MRASIIATAVAAVLLACWAGSAGAAAQHKSGYRYRWHDHAGQLHYSDSLTEEAVRNGYDVISDQGLVVRHVQRHLNASERQAADAAAAREAAREAAIQRQRDQDRQMLAAYPNERVLRDALQAEIDDLDQTIHTTQMNLRAQERSLADLLAHAAEIEHGGKDVPKFMNDRIAEQRKAVAEQRDALQRQQAAKAAAEQDVEKRLQRYRALRAGDRPASAGSGG